MRQLLPPCPSLWCRQPLCFCSQSCWLVCSHVCRHSSLAGDPGGGEETLGNLSRALGMPTEPHRAGLGTAERVPAHPWGLQKPPSAKAGAEGGEGRAVPGSRRMDPAPTGPEPTQEPPSPALQQCFGQRTPTAQSGRFSPHPELGCPVGIPVSNANLQPCPPPGLQLNLPQGRSHKPEGGRYTFVLFYNKLLIYFFFFPQGRQIVSEATEHHQ